MSYPASRADETLTVADLIERLSALDGSLKVWADGCDCSNPVSDVKFVNDATGHSVVLEVEL